MKAHLPTLRHAVVAAAAAFALTACGAILPKNEPMEILQPQVQVTPDPAWPRANWQLAIPRPNANEMLDSRRLVVSPTAGRIEVYKGVAWFDQVPDIVQSSTVAAFEDSGKILAVGRQANGLRADFALQLDLRNDEAVYRTPAGPPEINLVVSARLIDFSGSRVIASRTFRSTATAAATDVHSVAHAFDAALGSFVHDLVGWTLVNGQQAHEADEQRKRERAAH